MCLFTSAVFLMFLFKHLPHMKAHVSWSTDWVSLVHWQNSGPLTSIYCQGPPKPPSRAPCRTVHTPVLSVKTSAHFQCLWTMLPIYHWLDGCLDDWYTDFWGRVCVCVFWQMNKRADDINNQAELMIIAVKMCLMCSLPRLSSYRSGGNNRSVSWRRYWLTGRRCSP